MTETSHFERERSRLIGEIAENLAKCVTSVNALNRNIENVVSVGAGFEPVHALWSQFQQVMLHGAADQRETGREEPILTPHFPQGTDETNVLPPGLAPGQGETALFQSTAAHEGPAKDA